MSSESNEPIADDDEREHERDARAVHDALLDRGAHDVGASRGSTPCGGV